MPHFMLQESCESTYWSAQIKSPQNRLESVRPVVERLGGKIAHGWLSFGDSVGRIVFWVVLLVAWPQVSLLSAQVIPCEAVSVPPIVRSEGVAERIGDIFVRCTLDPDAPPPPPGNNHALADISLSLNTSVTNNIDFLDPDPGSTISDAVLVVNENNAGEPTVVSTLGGLNLGFPRPQYGELKSPTRLEWEQVMLPIPCASPPQVGCTFPETTVLRFTNVRANVSQLPPSQPATLLAFVSINVSNPPAFPVSNNVLTVALGLSGLIDVTRVPPATPHADFEVRVAEGFATAFRPLGIPDHVRTQAQEAGYPTPGSGVNNGGASQGTRIVLKFPGSLRSAVYVPGLVENESHSLKLARVHGADSDGSGGDCVSLTSKLARLDGKWIGGYAVYEVVKESPIENEHVDIPVFSTGRGTRTRVVVGFAPLSQVSVADGPAPEPRFLDTSVVTVPSF